MRSNPTDLHVDPARRLHPAVFEKIPIQRATKAEVAGSVKRRSMLDDFTGLPASTFKVVDGKAVATAIEPMAFLQVNSYRRDCAEVTEQHRFYTGDDLRESQHYNRFGASEKYSLKRRLVRFDRSNGRGRRRNKRAKSA